jgi:asparagine synthase (glutamine-hydrolysing)
MCGLTAILNFDGAPIDRRRLELMTGSIQHRGPDDVGYYVDSNIGLGFRRLAILDLTPSGHQPMSTLDGRYVIVFNGEIFNYIELRAELKKAGHTFRSSGDTEVLLYAYKEWGLRCVERFNGMWAFLIYDTQTRTVVGARDRFGVKPLYYYRDANRMLLGSEIKAIRDSGYYERGADWKTAARFLLRGELDNTERSLFDEIRQVPAGHVFEIDRHGAIRFERYWTLDSIAERNEPDAPCKVRDLFTDSVRLRLRSDVPVGITLSGGLDSTSVICAATRLKQADPGADPAATLAFSFNAKEFDESRYLADTIAQTSADLKQVTTNPLALWESLDKVLWYQDEPMHSLTAVVGYKIMELAAQNGVKVVLSGQGADETLAGYPSYFANTWHSLLRKGRLTKFWSEIGQFVDVHAGSRLAHVRAEIMKLARTGVAGTSPYRAFVRTRRRRALLQHPWFNRELVSHVLEEEQPPLDLRLRSALRGSVEAMPLPLYLRIEDRNSMAHSVEARLPFMDFRLVSLAFSLEETWKMRGPWNKYVLREAMRGLIPESVRSRPDKMGFPVPQGRWFREELFAAASDIVNGRSVAERGIYNVTAIKRDLERHRLRQLDVASDLFKVIQFERWFTICRAPRAA